MPAYAKDAFLESLVRCRARSGFLEAFYERFIESDPAIRHKFRLTKIERQAAMLDQSLRVCAAAVDGQPDALVRLSELATSHDRDHHDVKAEWYPQWLEALVATAAETDPEWNESIEEAWRKTLGHVIRHMASRYEGRGAR